jgi:hypothetical protein
VEERREGRRRTGHRVEGGRAEMSHRFTSNGSQIEDELNDSPAQLAMGEAQEEARGWGEELTSVSLHSWAKTSTFLPPVICPSEPTMAEGGFSML